MMVRGLCGSLGKVQNQSVMRGADPSTFDFWKQILRYYAGDGLALATKDDWKGFSCHFVCREILSRRDAIGECLFDFTMARYEEPALHFLSQYHWASNVCSMEGAATVEAAAFERWKEISLIKPATNLEVVQPSESNDPALNGGTGACSQKKA